MPWWHLMQKCWIRCAGFCNMYQKQAFLLLSVTVLCTLAFASTHPGDIPLFRGTRRKRSIPSITDVFPEVQNDLSRVKWAHGVTSKKALQQALRGSVMMIEADVSWGTLKNNKSTSMPIMAHPPALLSDLSLDEFLDNVFNNRKPKGIKLDFKDNNVVEPALQLLKAKESQIQVPIWLNADVIPGPVNATNTPIEVNHFLQLCKNYFPTAVLSVGWTTKFGPDIKNPSFIIKDGSYSNDQVKQLREALTNAGITQPVTFPVRAGIAASEESRTNLLWLLHEIPDSTLTLWSSPYDTVDVPELMELIRTVGKERIYIDVPDGLRCQITSFDVLTSGSVSLFWGRTRRIPAVTLLAILTALACTVINKPWNNNKYTKI